MPDPSSSRVLFLDDSGKPAARDSTKAVVIGGFSIPSENVPTLSRRIAGAKSRFYPDRGDPATWEVKAKRTLAPNAWKRSKNRQFLAETMRILGDLDCTVYTVSIDKRRLMHPMELQTTMPLQIQGLVEHFSVECATRHETGFIVSDWSNQDLDAHASSSVGSFVISRRLPLHPTIYYANSLNSHPIQVATSSQPSGAGRSKAIPTSSRSTINSRPSPVHIASRRPPTPVGGTPTESFSSEGVYKRGCGTLPSGEPAGSASRRQPNAADVPWLRDPGTHGVLFFAHELRRPSDNHRPMRGQTAPGTD